jgi:hypothetical protein
MQEPEIIEILGNRKINIKPSKHEPLLQPFESSDNIAEKFIKEVSDDPILREFLFLQSVIIPRFDTVTISYPFCFHPNYDILVRIKRGTYQLKRTKLDERLANLWNEYKVVSLTSSIFTKTTLILLAC